MTPPTGLARTAGSSPHRRRNGRPDLPPPARPSRAGPTRTGWSRSRCGRPAGARTACRARRLARDRHAAMRRSLSAVVPGRPAGPGPGEPGRCPPRARRDQRDRRVRRRAQDTHHDYPGKGVRGRPPPVGGHDDRHGMEVRLYRELCRSRPCSGYARRRPQGTPRPPPATNGGAACAHRGQHRPCRARPVVRALADRCHRGGRLQRLTSIPRQLMAQTREHVRQVLATYIRAWETQDPELITTIFTLAATYHERVMGDPIPDREAIRRYWVEKVVRAQANISCRLLSLYIDGDTAIAEWVAEFDDLAHGVRKRMKEIAVLEFDGARIRSLREYWASESLGAL